LRQVATKQPYQPHAIAASSANQALIKLSTLGPNSSRAISQESRAILDAARSTRRASRGPDLLERWALATQRPVSEVAQSRKYLRLVVLALLLFVPLPNFAHPDVIYLPFRTVQSMILVQGKVNGKPVTFLLDTGATRTIVSAKVYGNVGYSLRLAQRAGQQPGFVGESVTLPVNLQLDRHTWLARRVSVMNFNGLSEVLGADFDGLLGEDVLREFHSVHIDYRNHQIELEQ
jgi:gag-polyprotein putative aspartyl protease